MCIMYIPVIDICKVEFYKYIPFSYHEPSESKSIIK